MLLGSALLRQGQVGRALEHLESAHTRAPAWREAMWVLGTAHERAGERARARQLVERCRAQEVQLAELLQAFG